MRNWVHLAIRGLRASLKNLPFLQAELRYWKVKIICTEHYQLIESCFRIIECIEKKYGKETLNKEAALFRRSAIKIVWTQRQNLQKNDVCTME